jgi:hypothetical protein
VIHAAAGIGHIESQSDLHSRRKLHSQLREGDFYFDQLRMLVRRMIRVPTRLAVCAQKLALTFVNVRPNIPFAQLVRNVQPALTFLSLLRPRIVRIDQNFREQSAARVRHAFKIKIQILRVVLSENAHVPPRHDRKLRQGSILPLRSGFHAVHDNRRPARNTQFTNRCCGK